MSVLLVFRLLAIILAICGTTFIIPIAVALVCGEMAVLPSFIIPMVVSWIVGIVMFFAGRKQEIRFSVRGSFVIVALAWIFMSLFGAIPLYFSGAIPSITDAVFESVSGFSTTGSTILSDIESLPRSINLWRCQTHWIGGLGIVALTVALLPLLGVGGFQLIKAETTGPEKGKVTPKMSTTAKWLWIIYITMTVVETLLLRISGMDWIDAISHAMATMGTGGFSTRNESIGAYHSAAIEWICTIFMFLGGINFAMYYNLITGKLQDIWQNTEFKVYLGIVFCCVLLSTLLNIPQYGGFGSSLRYSAFQIMSVLSTTGFASSDFTTWVPAAQLIILMLFFVGGCSGSTGGGVKVIRWVILAKQLKNEQQRLIHPHGIFTIRLDGKVGRKDIVFSVAAFMFLFVILVLVTAFVGTLGGLDVFSAVTGALSMVGNIGPGFNLLGPSCNFGFLPGFVKWWYCFAMLAGRLELYTMLIYFSVSYWKK